MTSKEASIIKLKNSMANAIAEAITDVAIVSLECKIKAYKEGMITAQEFIEHLQDVAINKV